MFKKHIEQFLQCVKDELPAVLQNAEEEQVDNEDNAEKNTEIVIGSLNFICNTFASIGMQNKILGPKLLEEIFDFFEYLGAITNSKYVFFFG